MDDPLGADSWHDKEKRLIVLIPILMDDPLGAAHKVLQGSEGWCVLIPILMDDPLGDFTPCILNSKRQES